MTYRDQREDNLLAQIIMFLLVIGLFMAADDDDNHWSVRVACAAILAVFPVALFLGVADSSFSDAFRANDITDGAWGFALLFSLLGLCVLGWVGWIVYRCIEHMSSSNGWLVIPIALTFSGLVVYWLWTLDIGWWKILAIPASYFVCCAIVEGLFTGADGRDLVESHEDASEILNRTQEDDEPSHRVYLSQTSGLNALTIIKWMNATALAFTIAGALLQSAVPESIAAPILILGVIGLIVLTPAWLIFGIIDYMTKRR